MRAFLLLITLGTLAQPAHAQPLEVFGYAGVLGEWKLIATVTEKSFRKTKEFSGPVTMTHVGLCTRDGPEEKTGEIRLQITNSSSRLTALLSVAGRDCTYTGRLLDFYTGMMICPDQEAVPLKLWVR